jgi:hypothetical protein
MTAYRQDDDDKSRGTYHSGGEGRGGAHWTSTPRPVRDSSVAPEHVTGTVPRDYRKIPGWGVDLEHRPSYPKELPSDVMTVRGEVRDWQIPHDKVHLSVEHPNLTPVFGTSCPPRGLSGLLRDYAYKFGEGANRHWMTLILADRIDILESTIIDALRGHPDRFIQEKGWKANVKYGISPSMKRALAVGGVVAGLTAIGYFLATRDER